MMMETFGLAKRLHRDFPIFYLPAGDKHCIYIPGYLTVVSPETTDKLKLIWTNNASREDNSWQKIADKFILIAKKVVETWQKRIERQFTPECLTIYLSNRCNCNCVYCYAVAGDGLEAVNKRNNSLIITPESVQSAAELVAQICQQCGRPFRLVIHGGGEPTIHWHLLQQLVALTRAIAASKSIEWWGHISSNGILPIENVLWLADSFNHICISCDGPPEIQDRQRPLNGGAKSSPFVEQTIRLLCERNAHFSIRATITPDTVNRQVDIVRYLAGVLGAKEIRFEPAYNLSGKKIGDFYPGDAPAFAENFLAAEQKAKELDCKLLYSGVRLDELHSTYCDSTRDVLHLIPDNTLSDCFLDVGEQTFQPNSTRIGYYNEVISTVSLNLDQINVHRQMSLKIPERCKSCINYYHCARECPEVCEIKVGEYRNTNPGFRCRVAHLLTERWILQLSDEIPVFNYPALTTGNLSNQSRKTKVLNMLSSVSSQVDTDEILKQWEAAKYFFHDGQRTLPAPLWAQRKFEHGNKEAWRILSAVLRSGLHNPLSIYVHIPFCDRKCDFCDCYSFPLPPRQKEDASLFSHTLLSEISAWAGLGGWGNRNVSTVHFGGGTPGYLDPDLLFQLIREIRMSFHTSDETEWALESTSTILTDGRVKLLAQMGFTRIHVGVQTLETEIRKNIGRKETDEQVISKLERLLEYGFIVSVDLIYGLPGQTVAGFMNTLSRLVSIGVQGFSLYQMQIGTRNRQFWQKQGINGRDTLMDYLNLQIADKYLQSKGYEKNHFSHYALPQDANLYYRHAVRDEDLLALGPTADGVFGDYHYRHGEYQDFMRYTYRNMPSLQGGLFESEIEKKIHKSAAQLMGGRIGKEMAEEIIGLLLDSWEDRQLLKRSAENGDYVLTGNGSWFIADMLNELRENYISR